MRLAKITSRFGLPLLAKELIEQAARKRTYVLRTLYASLLFVASFLFFHDLFRMNSSSPFAVLGHGREVFNVLMGLQFAGVYLFMPAITCGVLTQEKERSSLMLLFLTRLGPWTILFEKLLGRMIPMLCFLLLSLPLLAFAYSLGGITAEYLWSGVWMLAVTVFQVGALALCCSAWFRTTVGAFVGSYLIGIIMLIGPGFLTWILVWGDSPHNLPFYRILESLGIYSQPDQVLFPLFAPIQFFENAAGSGGFAIAVIRSIPILFLSGAFLVLARVFIVRRAFVSPRNLLLGLFKRLDREFSRLNQNRITRGFEVIRSGSPLPDGDPVAWRETSKRSFGRAQYLFRIFIAIEVPLGCIILVIAFLGGDADLEGAKSLVFLLWVVAVLLVSVQSASLIAGERSHQTLDVLATTPLTGRDILQQKFRAVRRLMVVLSIPFMTMFVLEAWWHGSAGLRSYGRYRETDVFAYLVCSALSVVIYLPMAAWLSFLIGLVVRTQARAIVGALGAIVGWCILPLVFIVMPIVIIFSLPGRSEDGWLFLLLLSPATIIPLNEYNDFEDIARFPWVLITLNFLGYGLITLVLRQTCLMNADRFLGRAESQ